MPSSPVTTPAPTAHPSYDHWVASGLSSALMLVKGPEEAFNRECVSSRQPVRRRRARVQQRERQARGARVGSGDHR